MDRKVLVIPTDKLFSLIPYFQGFWPVKRGVLRILEENSMWLDRKQAEEDPAFKQLIGYCVISWIRQKNLRLSESQTRREVPGEKASRQMVHRDRRPY